MISTKKIKNRKEEHNPIESEIKNNDNFFVDQISLNGPVDNEIIQSSKKEDKVIWVEILEELSNKSQNEVIFYLNKNYKDLPLAIKNSFKNKNSKYYNEKVYLMINILNNIIQINNNNSNEIISKIISNTNFLIDVVFPLMSEESIIAHVNQIEYLYFFLFTVEFITKAIEKFPKYTNILKSIDIFNKAKFLEAYSVQSYSQTIDTYNLVTEISNKKYNYLNLKQNYLYIKEEDYQLKKFPINYKEIPDYIEADELLNKPQIELHAHIPKGSYYSYERYINTLYYLEREDCYRSLKQVVHYVSQNYEKLREIKFLIDIEKKFSDIYFYHKCKIGDIKIGDQGVIIEIAFSTVQEKIKFTKRMLYGSLLLLTSGNVHEFLITTVFDNPYNMDFRKKKHKKIPAVNNNNNINQTPPEIGEKRTFIYNAKEYKIKVRLPNITYENIMFAVKNNYINSGKELYIFESKAYYESYIHILKRLKNMNICELPFRDELIFGNFENMESPLLQKKNYILKYSDDYKFIIQKSNKKSKNDNIYANNNINNINNINNNDDINDSFDNIINIDTRKYPNSLINKLDNSQLNAINLCLNNKIAVIQGPPGTGKTYVGGILTKIILQNMDSFKEEGKSNQILIVCYTNHALDQFLELISQYTDSIKRIGGRIKSEKIQQFKFIPHNHWDRSNSNKIKILREKIEPKINFKISFEDIKNNYGHVFNIIYDDFLEIILPLDKKITNNKLKKLKIKEKYIDDIVECWLGKKDLIKVAVDFYYLFNGEVSQQLKKLEKQKDSFKDTNADWRNINLNNINEEIAKLKKKYDNDGIEEKCKKIFEDYYKNNDYLEREINIELLKSDEELLINKDKSDFNPEFNNQEEDSDEDIDLEDDYYDAEENENRQELENIYDYSEDNNNEDDDEEFKNYQNDNYYNINEYINNEQEKIDSNLMIEDISKKNQREKFYINLKTRLVINFNKYKQIMDNWNIFKVGPLIRHQLIEFIRNNYYNNYVRIDSYKDSINDYINCYDNLINNNLIQDSNLLKRYKIIAMTTTGCSKYSQILENCNFEFTIIEEAAEVLESHVVSLLTKNTEHLIMIGDHQQLRPKPYNYALEKYYNFDISLFERLINNNIPFERLKFQRRMKPIFADFVRLIYGNSSYEDYKDLYNREHIKGMKSDMFIITHNHPENEDNLIASHSNEYEAEYLARLFIYLLYQGYKEEQITIIGLYSGQLLTLRKYIKKYYSIYLNEQKDILVDKLSKKIKDIKTMMRKIKTVTVDNYQGEENDIILLSLVRSNPQNDIGFLKSFNRVCVAFSRAKLGFYIIGNIDCLIKGENEILKKKNNNNNHLKFRGSNKNDEKLKGIFQQIKDLAQSKGIIDSKLTLVCQNHPNHFTVIKSIKDFDNCPMGGCNQRCEEISNCDKHVCSYYCHQIKHSDLKCFEITNYDPGCHHIIRNIICWKTSKIRCKVFVNNRMLICGHSINNVKCHFKEYQITCNNKCNAVLKCGHKCSGTCGRCLNGTLHRRCNKQCNKILLCGHLCYKKCGEICCCPYPNCKEYIQKYRTINNNRQLIPKKAIIIKIANNKFLIKTDGFRNDTNDKCIYPLPCGHACLGLKNERCPNLCRICDAFNNDLIKNEKNKDTIYYMLSCNHIFPVEELDTKFIKNREFPVCPKCKMIIGYENKYFKIKNDAINNARQLYLISDFLNSYYEDEVKLLCQDIWKKMNNIQKKSFAYNKILSYADKYTSNKFIIFYFLKFVIPLYFIERIYRRYFNENESKNLIIFAKHCKKVLLYIKNIKTDNVSDNNKNDNNKNNNSHKPHDKNVLFYNNEFYKQLNVKIFTLFLYSLILANKNNIKDKVVESYLFCLRKINDKEIQLLKEKIEKCLFSFENSEDFINDLYHEDKKEINKNKYIYSFPREIDNLQRCFNGHLYPFDVKTKNKCPFCEYGVKIAKCLDRTYDNLILKVCNDNDLRFEFIKKNNNFNHPYYFNINYINNVDSNENMTKNHEIKDKKYEDDKFNFELNNLFSSNYINTNKDSLKDKNISGTNKKNFDFGEDDFI